MYTGGRLAYWEDIVGDRVLVPAAKKATIEDTFGIYRARSTSTVAYVHL